MVIHLVLAVRGGIAQLSGLVAEFPQVTADYLWSSVLIDAPPAFRLLALNLLLQVSVRSDQRWETTNTQLKNKRERGFLFHYQIKGQQGQTGRVWPEFTRIGWTLSLYVGDLAAKCTTHEYSRRPLSSSPPLTCSSLGWLLPSPPFFSQFLFPET